MARAIVTYGRSWQSLAITRSLGRQGIEVFCGEEAPFAPCFFSRYCCDSFQYPSVSEEPDEFVDFMVEKVKELKPAEGEPYVLMPMHKETWLVARHRDRFEPHISVPLTSHENMARTHDKGQLAVMAEGINRMHKVLRMRARPKVLVAKTYEQGMEYYQRFGGCLFGVITDVRFARGVVRIGTPGWISSSW